MFDFFKRLFAQPITESKIELPGMTFCVNKQLRVVFIYDLDSNMRDDRYEALEAHLAKKHYFLQVVVASVGMPMSQSFQNEA